MYLAALHHRNPDLLRSASTRQQAALLPGNPCVIDVDAASMQPTPMKSGRRTIDGRPADTDLG
jgi:hypothetical protein